MKWISAITQFTILFLSSINGWVLTTSEAASMGNVMQIRNLPEGLLLTYLKCSE